MCTIAIANKSNCYVFHSTPTWTFSDTRVWVSQATWSGGCLDGRAHGNGTLVTNYSLIKTHQDKVGRDQGTLVNGVRHGHWVHTADGLVQEGHFIDGKRQGYWVTHYPGGAAVGRGLYVDDNLLDNWIIRYPGGMVEEGPHLHGKRHGHWILRYSDGTTKTYVWSHGEIINSY